MATKNWMYITKYKNLIFFLLLLILVFVYYGRITQTWFRQDEWYFLGHYEYYNSLDGLIPFSTAFQGSLFTLMTRRFTPIHDALFAAAVHFFGLNFTYYAIVSLVWHTINSFLVYLLAKKITKSTLLGILTAILFATNSISQEPIVWVEETISTQGAATFILLAIYSQFIYLKQKKARALGFSLFFTFVALWFKETAFCLFLILPALAFVYGSSKQVKKTIKYVAIFIVTYSVAKIILSTMGGAFHTDYRVITSGRTPATLIELAVMFTLLPFRIVTDAFFNPNTIYSFSRFITKFVFFPINFSNPELFAETQGATLVTVLLSILIGAMLYKLFIKAKKPDKKIMVTAVIIIFSLVAVHPLLISRGRAAVLTPILRSRDLYYVALGSSLVIALIVKYYPKKGLLFLILLLVYHYYSLNFLVLPPKIKEGQTRKAIVEKVYSLYPEIQPKSVFYFTSDTSYYGNTETSMPFQTGFGRTLLVWYALKNPDFPKELLGDTFLYFIFDHGYKEYRDYGFGYYRNYNDLAKAVKTNNLSSDWVYAFEYSGDENKLVDSTDKIRAKLAKELTK